MNPASFSGFVCAHASFLEVRDSLYYRWVWSGTSLQLSTDLARSLLVIVELLTRTQESVLG